MRIELHLTEYSFPDYTARTYDINEDDVRSILLDVCEAIGQQGEFAVSGFGQDRWPVDVQTDLLVFMEQLPAVLRAIGDGGAANIEFYEQGIERAIALSCVGDLCIATCTSRTKWRPNPMVEEIERDELKEMLLAVQEVFMRAFTEMDPGLIKHPWVQRWLAGLFA